MRVLWFSFILLVVDQVSKTLVYIWMMPGQSIPVIGGLLKFTYTTNPGMAFGLELGPKLFLSVFSIIATLGLIGYLWMVRGAPLGYRVSLAAVIGGALGNVIDRTFYGVFYGYGPLFHGEVIDFVHVDLWRGFVDLPVLGTQFIPLFPIWNVADMAIVLGVVAVIITQRQLHRQTERLAREQESGPSGHGEVAAPVQDGQDRAIERDGLPAGGEVHSRIPAPSPREEDRP